MSPAPSFSLHFILNCSPADQDVYLSIQWSRPSCAGQSDVSWFLQSQSPANRHWPPATSTLDTANRGKRDGDIETPRTRLTQRVAQENDTPDDTDSTLSDNASSTASLVSSILQYRTLHGRSYQSERGNTNYWCVQGCVNEIQTTNN